MRRGLALSLVLFTAVARADDETMMGPSMTSAPAPVSTAAAPEVTAVSTATLPEVPALARELDACFDELWAGSKVAPDAPPGELLRRLTLDLAGRVPTLEEARSFLADRDPDRVRRTVERILASRECAENLADGLTVAFLGRDARLEALDRTAFRDWLAARLHGDAPLDGIARDLLTARTDSAARDPQAQYLLLGGDAASLAGRTARIFLGNRIACAQCHDHPYEPWKRTDFWSLAAYFQRVRRQDVKGPVTVAMRKKKQLPRTVDWKLFEASDGETRIPLQNGETGRPALALPRFLGGRYDLTLHASKEPRLPALARAITVENRAAFARAMANRLFATLFGRGVVHPEDDFSEAHPPVHAGLLDAIGRGLAAGGLRVKPFLRALVLTRAYARASSSDADPDLFARARHRPLAPERLARALVTATRADAKQLLPLRRRLVGLLARNDEDDPHQVAESIPQALVLMNGPELNQLCAPRPGSLAALAAAEKDLVARVDLLHLAAFTREATPREREEALDFFRRAKDPKKATEDYLWTLLNSSEFLYAH